MRESRLMSALLHDGGSALRSLRREPGFALFTALVIGLGVGATTAVFSVLRPLLFEPLPFPEADRLVWISNVPDAAGAPQTDASLSAVTSRSGNLRDFRERGRVFEGLTGYNAFSDQTAYTLTGRGEPERLSGMEVAHDFLAVLGVEPLLGRGFTEEEGLWGGPTAVILTHALWQHRFAADPSLVGEAVVLNGTPRTVVGVLPPSFDFASVFRPGTRTDFLLPFPISEETNRQGNTMMLIGRLRPGVTAAAAQADLDRVLEALRAEQPNRWGLAARVTPLREQIAGPFRPALLLLAGAAATVLLIVCVNVSNLLLARVPAQVRDVAIRKALGASRGRIVRQLLFGTGAIALAGAAVGGVLAWLAVRVVAGGTSIGIPLLDRVTVDGTALLFGTGVALLTGLAVGLVPALHVSEGSEAAVMRAAGRGSAGRGARRLRESLVIAEVALACTLLVTGGLFLRSFRSVLDLDMGFDADGVVAWQLNPSRGFESLAEKARFFAAAVDRVETSPGIDRAGVIDAMPLGRSRSWGFSVVGVPEEEDTDDGIHPHMIDPGYLPAMGIALVAGRNFTAMDGGDAPPVVLMNASGARRVFGDVDPLGRRIQLWDAREWEVVGIVRDVRHIAPEMDPGIQVYFPMAQQGDYRTMDLVVHSPLPVEQVVARVSAALRELDPAMPTGEFWTLRARVDLAVSDRRFTVGVLAAYGAVALFLAALGIYGVLAHSVAQRRPEIGIRMALGASSRSVLWDVIGRTLFLAAAGVAIGALFSLWSGRLLGSMLHGVGAADPLTFATMAGLLLAVAAAAGAIPAVRAARTRALGVLRAD